MDKEEKKAKKEAQEADKLDLEKKENDILSGETQRTADAARNKRKHSKIPSMSGTGGSTSTGSSGAVGSDSSPWNALDDIIWGRQRKQEISEPKPLHRMIVPNQEPLKKYFSERSMAEVAADLKMRRPEFVGLLEDIEEFSIRMQFHMARWNYEPFEKAMISFGLNNLEAFKLFCKLQQLCDEFAEAEKEKAKGAKTPDA
jgi:hypothetical protein